LEDVASIVITSFSVNIHAHLLLQAAKQGVALILCETFKPTSLVLPANRSTDTLLSRALVKLEDKTRATLWLRTVDAKCANQYSLAGHIAPDDPRLPTFRATALGRKAHKEAVCAKYFWGVVGSVIGGENFTRGRHEGGLNDLLNYGYAILLSTVLQKLFAVGLDPTFGLSHAQRERATPLAYDLMEPFRPCVDWRVLQWVRDHPDPAEWQVTPDYRRWVTGFPLAKVDHLDFTLEVQGCVEGVVRGFRRAVLDNNPRAYKPWTQQNSKWVG